jgi:hypothetical protein
MYVSQETTEQTDARLRRVIAASELTWHEGQFAFYEFPVGNFPTKEPEHGLALVRDEEVWSVLKVAGPEAAEPFGLFSFHFQDGLDNSGFVGWLASILKRELGTGVFVVCGQNSRRGGIFDYWGVPLAMRNAAMRLLNQLRQDSLDRSGNTRKDTRATSTG